MLDVQQLNAGYAGKTVLRNFDLRLADGECAGIIGHNGAGKSTALAAMFGLRTPSSGRVVWNGRDVTRRSPAQHVAAGMAFVSQGARVFTGLTIAENLTIAAFTVKSKATIRRRMAEIYELYPKLAERRKQRAGLLSGGERQTLVLGMALMVEPRLILLDEPFVGLSPIAVAGAVETIRNLNVSRGTMVIMVDQNAKAVLQVVSRAYVLRAGQVARSLDPAELRSEDSLRKIVLTET